LKKDKEAKAKSKEAKAKSKEANGATKVPNYPTKANFQANLEKAKKATKDIKGTMTAAVSQMFGFYAILLYVKSKYAWIKIIVIVEQMESNLYVNLQGVSLEGPRECPASHSTIAWSSICSPCFPSMRQSKKGTTSQMYLRSPSASTYVSLYAKQSNSTPTLLRCRASITAPMQMPAPSPRTFPSWRLS
jgi:hypothetical protein